MLQLVTPHILTRKTTYNYIHSSSEVKATVEYFLKITERERNLCQAGGDAVVAALAGGGGGGGGDDGGREAEQENLFPHSASCPRMKRCRECLNEVQGPGYERARAALSNQSQQCQHCKSTVCKEHRRVVCVSCSHKFVLNENNNNDWEVE